MKAKRVRKKSFAGLRTYRNGALLSPSVKTKTGKKKRKRKKKKRKRKKKSMSRLLWLSALAIHITKELS
jgi:hypothetical protein